MITIGISGTVSQLPLANLVISVTAETKNAMRQMQSLQSQTKKTDKKATGSMALAIRGLMIAATTVALVVAGIGIAAVGVWGLFKASSYYPMYSKMWANEATIISNEWVRRHKGVFDNLTKTIEKIRREYVSNKDQTIPGSIAKVLMGGLSDKTSSMKTSIITKGMAFLTTITQRYDWILSYLQMWVTYYIMPIYTFVEDILTIVGNILTAIKNFIDAVWAALSILPGI